MLYIGSRKINSGLAETTSLVANKKALALTADRLTQYVAVLYNTILYM